MLWNKRDLPHAETVERMEEILNFQGQPSFACTAVSGAGLREAFEGLFEPPYGTLMPVVARDSMSLCASAAWASE